MAIQPNRENGSVDLRSYAAIGDGRTVALIALDGAVDWLPIPALDSAPTFARLLDAERGGFVELQPTEPFTVTRRYVPGTNVLETTFRTASGSARVTDALVTGVAGRLPWVELARRIDGIKGAVTFRWRVEPGTMLGTAQPWADETIHGKVLRIDGVTLAVRGSKHGQHGGGHRAIAGRFTTEAKSRHLVIIAGTADEPVHMPHAESTDAVIDRTIASWKSWSREFSYDGPWADAVQRSALALKLLIHSPTGAIAAAATTSVPETMDGEKNWDYRFGWVRDVAYTLDALLKFGLREEPHAAVSWLLSAIRRNGPELRVFYTLDGALATDPVKRDVAGWRGVGPVVVGNPAGDQLQLGVYGDLLRLMRSYVAAGNVLDVQTGRLLATIADAVCDQWQLRDSGMWELPELREYTSSRMGCWAALDAAVVLCEQGQVPGSAERWRAERDAISAWVSANCWSAELGAWVAWPGSDRLDASVLLHSITGFDRGPRMSSTIDAIRQKLAVGPLVYRYTGAEHEEGAFVACGFWVASALACVGRGAEASNLMGELVALGNDVGLYAEMIDPEDLSFLGNLPQALSHLALISAATTIAELGGAK
ncbi:MAG: glycoside hydrolase family 15 protein [Microbacteriaceae bacterium]|nr:glycoside hydrolase family 15 protein [Microbacteriaceae bacterium]